MQNQSPSKDAKQLLFDATRERAKKAEKGVGVFTIIQRFLFPTLEDIKRSQFVKEWKMLEKEEMDIFAKENFYTVVRPIYEFTCLQRKQQWRNCVLLQQENSGSSNEKPFPSQQEIQLLIQTTTETSDNLHVFQAITKRLLQIQAPKHFQYKTLQSNLQFIENSLVPVNKDATLIAAIASGKFDSVCEPCSQQFTNLQNCTLKGFQNSVSACGGSICRGQLAEFRTTPNKLFLGSDFFLNWKWNQFTKCVVKQFEREGKKLKQQAAVTKEVPAEKH